MPTPTPKTLADVQASFQAFHAALVEALQRTALVLPEHWRWLQYSHAWVVSNVTYAADNRLSSYKLTYNSQELTVQYTYETVHGYIASKSLVSSEGTVTINYTYAANGNLTGSTFTLS